jgi:RNA polymerase sigma factor (sigma-70 family)
MSDSRLDAIDTRWSLIRQAHAAGQDQSAARASLVLRYGSSIRRYVGALIKDPQDADEVAQEIMVRLLQGNFAGADPDRGRFRDLLRVAIRNLARDFWARQKKRQGAALELDLLPDANNEQEAAWLSAWQHSVLEHALAKLKDFEREHPASAAHTLLQWRLQFPEDASEDTAARLATKLGKAVRADAARQLLRRARRRFAEILVEETGMGLADTSPGAIEEELAALGLLEHVRDFLPDDWKERGRLAD